MCMPSVKAPSPPPLSPEAPTAPDTSITGDTQANRDKRRRAAASTGGKGTILTGPRGTTTQANTSTKTLLGE